VDAGCGSGRDSKWLIERGYEVYSYDPFDPLATLAAEHLARSFPHLEIIVHRHAHDELSRHIGPGAAVGIFASASVIFLTNLELIQAFDEFAGALAKGGRLYASFKSGTGWKNGSRHLQLTDAAFINSLNPKLQMVDCWSSQDTLGRGIGWTVFVLARLE
jgi:SAM-dependent methyltransferase